MNANNRLIIAFSAAAHLTLSIIGSLGRYSL